MSETEIIEFKVFYSTDLKKFHKCVKMSVSLVNTILDSIKIVFERIFGNISNKIRKIL